MPKKNAKTADNLRLEVAALRLALQKLADASETLSGDDPDSGSYRDDEAAFDTALDEARELLVETVP